MKQIFPDLWQTHAEHPFAGVTSHAYLLVRDTGNVLFYSSGLKHEYRQLRELGGIAYQYLSHRDEAGPALAEIKELFGSKLCCHRLEEPSIGKVTSVDCLFDKRESLLADIEVIPTPGHTDGSVCFLVRSVHGKLPLHRRHDLSGERRLGHPRQRPCRRLEVRPQEQPRAAARPRPRRRALERLGRPPRLQGSVGSGVAIDHRRRSACSALSHPGHTSFAPEAGAQGSRSDAAIPGDAVLRSSSSRRRCCLSRGPARTTSVRGHSRRAIRRATPRSVAGRSA